MDRRGTPKLGLSRRFSPSSLWEIDRFFDEHSKDGQATPDGLLVGILGSRIFAIGAYIGEVIRRSKGGEWIGDDADPEAEIGATLKLPDGKECWPVQRAMKRFKNGPEDGIAAYGFACFDLAVGSRPAPPPEEPWWKIW